MFEMIWALLGILGLNKLYIDCDGTLVESKLDDQFKKIVKEEGIKNAIAWYENQKVNNLRLNIQLINDLIRLKEMGIELVLWTNRGSINIDSTKENLGVYWYMFSDHMFMEGKKGKCIPLDGVVIDNEEKYVGKNGVLIDTFNG